MDTKIIKNKMREYEIKAINEKYEKYKSIYKEWEDGGKENSKLYKKIWSLREEIAQDYIDYRIDQIQIEKY